VATPQSNLVSVTNLEDSTDVWLLKRRHEDTSTMFRTSWDIYIKFYTVFLTFSMAAMGLVLTRTPPKNVAHILAEVFIGESLLCAISSAFMAVYTRWVARDLRRLEKALLGSAPAPGVIAETSAIPSGLASWAGWANAVGMVGLGCAWAYIAFR
jgi:hypothetical protein